MTTFFTSDEHVGHRNIITYSGRPFANVDVMREELVRRHNERVSPDDVVYHVGDLALDDRLVRDYVSRLHGNHYLLPGNHDACHPLHSRHARAREKYIEWGFADVLPITISLVLRGFGEVLVSHMPYAGDRSETDRFPQFRPNDAGFALLHGHVHDLWKRRDRMLNVGVDQWDFYPVSEAEIVAELSA